MSESQINTRLASVISLMNAQPIVFSSMIVIGLIGLAVGGFLLYKHHHHQKLENADFNWDKLVQRASTGKAVNEASESETD